jgi:hypothetical protein
MLGSKRAYAWPRLTNADSNQKSWWDSPNCGTHPHNGPTGAGKTSSPGHWSTAGPVGITSRGETGLWKGAKSPKHLKSFSPQMPAQDKKIKSEIFMDGGIIVEHGKNLQFLPTPLWRDLWAEVDSTLGLRSCISHGCMPTGPLTIYLIISVWYRANYGNTAEDMIMDRRNYPRTGVSIPIEVNVWHLEATEEPWIGRGVLGNLSLTGIFFFPDNHPPLKQGDIRDFTFALPHAIEGFSRPSIIKARGIVMRIEISEDHICLGVAVDFLTGPYFS